MSDKLVRLKGGKYIYLRKESRAMASAIHAGYLEGYASLDDYINKHLKLLASTLDGNTALCCYLVDNPEVTENPIPKFFKPLASAEDIFKRI